MCGAIYNKSYLAHRVSWALFYGEWPRCDIDHINGARDDNRISNLRTVSSEENSKNARKRQDNTSGVAGVEWDERRKKWRARIYSNKKEIHLGRFSKRIDAITARKNAEVKYGYHPNHGRD